MCTQLKIYKTFTKERQVGWYDLLLLTDTNLHNRKLNTHSPSYHVMLSNGMVEIKKQTKATLSKPS